MRTYDAKTKALTARSLGHGPVLLVSDQGDLSNFETTVWRGDRRARRWVSVDTGNSMQKAAMIQRADSLSLKGDDVLVRTGAKTTKLSGTAVVELNAAMRKPEGASFTLDAWRFENRDALKALYSTIGKDASLPILTTLNLRSEDGGIKAYATDRYKLGEAMLGTASKPVDFQANVRGSLLKELVTNRAWHLTVWEDFALAEFCETGVRVQTMNVTGSYPKVENLFAEYAPEHTATWTVTPSLFARVVRDMNPPRNNPVALSRDGLIAGEGAGSVRPAGVVEVQYQGEAQRWVAMSHEYLAQILRSVSGYPEARILWGPAKANEESMKPVYFEVSDRLRLLLMPTRGAGRSFPVANISEG